MAAFVANFQRIRNVAGGSNIGPVAILMFQLFSFFQQAAWLIFLNISYYSLAFRIRQLTLFLQRNEKSVESDIESDKENNDKIVESNSNLRKKGYD